MKKVVFALVAMLLLAGGASGQDAYMDGRRDRERGSSPITPMPQNNYWADQRAQSDYWAGWASGAFHTEEREAAELEYLRRRQERWERGED